MTKPKAHTAVAKAIARHKAANTALDAEQDDTDEIMGPLFDAYFESLDKLAKTPCSSDAEFLEKLRYLAAQEAEMCPSPKGTHEYGSVVIAVAKYCLRPRNPKKVRLSNLQRGNA
jgi:hypothetical protein